MLSWKQEKYETFLENVRRSGGHSHFTAPLDPFLEYIAQFYNSDELGSKVGSKVGSKAGSKVVAIRTSPRLWTLSSNTSRNFTTRMNSV